MSNSIVDLVNNLRNNGNLIQQPQQPSNPQMQQLKSLYQQMQHAPNGQAMLQNMMLQNPNIKNIFNLAQINNLSLPQLAQFMAQQKGIDLNQLIKELQSPV